MVLTCTASFNYMKSNVTLGDKIMSEDQYCYAKHGLEMKGSTNVPKVRLTVKLQLYIFGLVIIKLYFRNN